LKTLLQTAAVLLALPMIVLADDCSTYPHQPGRDAEIVEGFAIPRIIATGEAIPFSEDVRDVADAMEEAEDAAFAEITEYMSVLLSSSREQERLTEKIAQQSGQNRETSKTTVETIVTTFSRSSAAVLRGTVLLGRCYTPPNKVLVTVGIKPETVMAAEGLAAGMADSLTSTPTLQSMRNRSGVSQSAAGLNGSKQTEDTAEEDNLRRVEGFSETGRLKDF